MDSPATMFTFPGDICSLDRVDGIILILCDLSVLPTLAVISPIPAYMA